MKDIIETIIMGTAILVAFVIVLCIFVCASPFIILGFLGYELLISGIEYFENREEKRRIENMEDII